MIETHPFGIINPFVTKGSDLTVASKLMRNPAKGAGRVRRQLLRLLFSFMLAVPVLGAGTAAHADLKLCNTTTSRVGVAIGYKDKEGWATEGWWNVAAHTCETLLKGVLIARYYYLHAVDYDRGGEWAGSISMCTDDKAFTIRETKNCVERGYKQTGFFEVDTGEERDWTIRLTDPGAEDTAQ
jgi:uncharacterized membrane protein